MSEQRVPDPSRLIYLTGGIVLVGLSAYFLVPAAKAALDGTFAGMTEVTVFLALIGLGLLACGMVALGVAAGWRPAHGRGTPGAGAASFAVLGGAAGFYWLTELRDTLTTQALPAAVVLVVFFALAGGMWGVALSGVYGALRQRRGTRVRPETTGDETV